MMIIKLMLIFIIVTTIFVLIYPSTIKYRNERMELKTNCDVRDRGCMIACQTAKTIPIYEECYKTCQHNSPVC